MLGILSLISSSTIYSIVMIAYAATILSIIIIVISENRNPVKSLAWITVLLLLPVAGLVLYAFFGRNLKNQRMISRRAKRKLLKNFNFQRVNINQIGLSEEDKQQVHLGLSLCGSEYFPGNSIDIYTNGHDKFEAFIADLKNANKYINLQYYIIENDEIGNRIKDILIEKARQGVQVRVIYDHVGCFNVKKSFFRQMEEAGIDVKPFMKVTFPQFATHVNWRNHRKITIIDGRIGYIGGMNIADRYINGGKHSSWRDTHIRICGPAVAALQYSFAVDRNFIGKTDINDEVHFDKSPDADNGIQLITSGPMGTWSNIALMLFKAIGNAKKCIYLQTPYFLPTEGLLKALQTAALSKVDVRIMIPRISDSAMLTYASYSYIKSCLSAGIKVFFYEEGMMHAKTMIIDDTLSTVGSTNLDFRSMEHNFEANVFIYSASTNAKLKEIFMHDLQKCKRVNSSSWRRRPLPQRFKESLVRLLSPIL